MKRLSIMLLLLAFALLLAACMYQAPQGTEGGSDPALQDQNTQPTDETEPPQPTYYYRDWTGIEEPIYTEDDVIFTENGIIAGPFTFEYIDTSIWFMAFDEPLSLYGLDLVSCEVDMTQVVIPSVVCNIPVVSIGYGNSQETLFHQNVPLEALYITDSVVYISYNAFCGCSELTDVRLSSGTKFLGAGGTDGGEPLLADTSVKVLNVPEGVTTIGFYTFGGSDVECLILPSTLTEFYTPAISNCPLKQVFFRGTEEACPQGLLNQVETETSATIYFYSETEPTEEGNFWHYVDGKPVIW